jgi:hypothetical protein
MSDKDAKKEEAVTRARQRGRDVAQRLPPSTHVVDAYNEFVGSALLAAIAAANLSNPHVERDLDAFVGNVFATQRDGTTLHFARIPIMVGSAWCPMAKLNDVERAVMNLRATHDGAFLYQGNEVTIDPVLRAPFNAVVVDKDADTCWVDSVATGYGTPQRTTLRRIAPTGHLVVDSPGISTRTPLFTAMRALGASSDKEIMDCCNAFEPLRASVHDAGPIFTQAAARQHPDWTILPHIADDLAKRVFLGRMVRCLLDEKNENENVLCASTCGEQMARTCASGGPYPIDFDDLFRLHARPHRATSSSFLRGFNAVPTTAMWGKIDPFSEANELASGARISTDSPWTADLVALLSPDIRPLPPRLLDGDVLLLVDGVPIGLSPNPLALCKTLREKRRQGQLPAEMSVSFDIPRLEVHVATGPGRLLRPIVPLGRIALEYFLFGGRNHASDPAQLVEFVDGTEENGLLIAPSWTEIVMVASKRFTHCELDASLLHGRTSVLFPTHNVAERTVAAHRYALLPSTNAPCLPLVAGLNEKGPLPGNNLLVAFVAPGNGAVVSQGAVDRGLDVVVGDTLASRTGYVVDVCDVCQDASMPYLAANGMRPDLLLPANLAPSAADCMEQSLALMCTNLGHYASSDVAGTFPSMQATLVCGQTGESLPGAHLGIVFFRSTTPEELTTSTIENACAALGMAALASQQHHGDVFEGAVDRLSGQFARPTNAADTIAVPRSLKHLTHQLGAVGIAMRLVDSTPLAPPIALPAAQERPLSPPVAVAPLLELNEAEEDAVEEALAAEEQIVAKAAKEKAVKERKEEKVTEKEAKKETVGGGGEKAEASLIVPPGSTTVNIVLSKDMFTEPVAEPPIAEPPAAATLEPYEPLADRVIYGALPMARADDEQGEGRESEKAATTTTTTLAPSQKKNDEEDLQIVIVQ